MSRLPLPMSALAVGLLALLGAPRAKQTTEVRRLTVEPTAIVWIESGSFIMGASNADLTYAVELCRRARPLPLTSLVPSSDGACADRRFVTMEAPRRREHTMAFGIDRTEVTHRAYRVCVVAGRCAPSRVRDEDGRLARSRMPVSGITAEEAEAYCAFRGGRLPTDVEWERAARGSDRHRFPWGRHYNDRLANHGRSPVGPDARDGFALAAPVGSFPGGASAYGLLDMAGNVWEWTGSSPDTDQVPLGADPTVFRVIRGGSWNQPAETLRVTHRDLASTTSHAADLGVRCAYDPR